VAIARALATQPRLLLADEPTGNLDSTNAEEILALFAETHGRGNTVILVTHDEGVARRARRIIHIRDGSIVRTDGFRAGPGTRRPLFPGRIAASLRRAMALPFPDSRLRGAGMDDDLTGPSATEIGGPQPGAGAAAGERDWVLFSGRSRTLSERPGRKGAVKLIRRPTDAREQPA
jgi:energy-coupling factor transporter ATP-binding protein EcfA2